MSGQTARMMLPSRDLVTPCVEADILESSPSCGQSISCKCRPNIPALGRDRLIAADQVEASVMDARLVAFGTRRKVPFLVGDFGDRLSFGRSGCRTGTAGACATATRAESTMYSWASLGGRGASLRYGSDPSRSSRPKRSSSLMYDGP